MSLSIFGEQGHPQSLPIGETDSSRTCVLNRQKDRSMQKNRKILIIGAGEFADIAYEYFTVDSDYEVAGFAVEAAYLEQTSKFDLPVVALEEAETRFPPYEVDAHVAVTSTKLNRVRAHLIGLARAKGYRLANFISPRAMVWRTAELGDNVFIFENNVVQHGVKIGNGCVLWSGNHVGHQTEIGEHCFVSSHVVISGYCKIGPRSFLGVNATFADDVTIGADSLVGMAAVVNKSYEEAGLILNGHPATPSKVSTYRYFKIDAPS
jgi:sugar O-acyltransferase (sialic acid O-acetyltransferase NeuD family)